MARIQLGLTVLPATLAFIGVVLNTARARSQCDLTAAGPVADIESHSQRSQKRSWIRAWNAVPDEASGISAFLCIPALMYGP